MRKHKRHGSYKFTEKTHSKRGIVATILALVLLVLYLVILELAFRANGGLLIMEVSECLQCLHPLLW